jgi:hypothetical protein
MSKDGQLISWARLEVNRYIHIVVIILLRIHADAPLYPAREPLSDHSYCQLACRRSGLVHVPCRRGAPALTDLIGGHVQAYFAFTASSIEYIKPE